MKENLAEKPVHEEENEELKEHDKKESTSDSNKTKEDVEKDDPKNAKEGESVKPKIVILKEEIVAHENILTVSSLKGEQLQNSVKKY